MAVAKRRRYAVRLRRGKGKPVTAHTHASSAAQAKRFAQRQKRGYTAISARVDPPSKNGKRKRNPPRRSAGAIPALHNGDLREAKGSFEIIITLAMQLEKLKLGKGVMDGLRGIRRYAKAGAEAITDHQYKETGYKRNPPGWRGGLLDSIKANFPKGKTAKQHGAQMGYLSALATLRMMKLPRAFERAKETKELQEIIEIAYHDLADKYDRQHGKPGRVPRTTTYAGNPKRIGIGAGAGITFRRVVDDIGIAHQVRYKHRETGENLRHDFETRVYLQALDDGSLRLAHPTKRLWSEEEDI